MRRHRDSGRKHRELRPLLEIVAETDDERLELLRVQEQVASFHSNYEWAARMRDEQRRLLAPDEPGAPEFGPGLDLDGLVAALTDIENAVNTLRVTSAQPADKSATPLNDQSLTEVEHQVAQLRDEIARVASMSATAAAQAAKDIEV